MIKLGVFFGGRSGEHEVSLMSASSVLRAIDQTKFQIVMIGITKEGKWLLYDGPVDCIEDGSWEAMAEQAAADHPDQYQILMYGDSPLALKNRIDFALPILHGPFGEDGTIQGLFEIMDIPYGGCGVLSSAVAMDKIVARDTFAMAGLAQPRYIRTNREEIQADPQALMDNVEEICGYPCFIKPANMGSSVGLSKAKDRGQLEAALELALCYDRRIIIEEGIDCREIETAALGNYGAEFGAIGEIISANEEFYDYESKYQAGNKTRLCIPAELTPEQEKEVLDMAQIAYKAIDGTGLARIDFLMDKHTGKLYINEINTMPGFTKYSMFPLLWQETGMTYAELIERIVELGYERYHAKNRK